MGDPIPQTEGAILGENVAAHCKVMGHSSESCAKTAEPIDMTFWMKTRVGQRNHALDGGGVQIRYKPKHHRYTYLNIGLALGLCQVNIDGSL